MLCLDDNSYETIKKIYKLSPSDFLNLIIDNIDEEDDDENIKIFEEFVDGIFSYRDGNNYIAEDIRKQYVTYKLVRNYDDNIFSRYSFRRERYYDLLKNKSRVPIEDQLKFMKDDNEKFIKDISYNLINRNYMFNRISDDLLKLYNSFLDESNVDRLILYEFQVDKFDGVLNLFYTMYNLESELGIDLKDRSEYIGKLYYDLFKKCKHGDNFVYLRDNGHYISDKISNPEYRNLTCSIELAKMFGLYFEDEELSKVKVRLKYFTTDALNRIAALSDFRRSVNKAIFNQIMENEKNN